jgi:hypothetical protein
MPVLYLLNTPILTAYGNYRFTGPLSLEEAKSRIGTDFVSAIGHQAAADFLSLLLGVTVPANRQAITMEPGDGALVLRIRERLPEGKLLNREEMMAIPYELSWLKRLS